MTKMTAAHLEAVQVGVAASKAEPVTAPDKMAMLALADRVEALAGPCRETDAEIHQAIGWLRDGYVRAIENCKERPYFWHGTDEKQPTIFAARFTESLDVAVEMTPDACRWSVMKRPTGHFQSYVWWPRFYESVNVQPNASAATPALALTAAALRAVAAGQP